MAEVDQPRAASAWTSTSSPCVSIGRGSSAAVALTPSASGGAPPRVLDGPSSGPDPAAQGWGVSVIRSGESPVIVNICSSQCAPSRPRSTRLVNRPGSCLQANMIGGRTMGATDDSGGTMRWPVSGDETLSDASTRIRDAGPRTGVRDGDPTCLLYTSDAADE